MSLDPNKLKSAIPRLEREANIWLATVRADGRPHLVPIWFVWHAGKIWICTPENTRKAINLKNNPRVALALEDGDHPLIMEGTATLRHEQPWIDELAAVFIRKFDWDIRKDGDPTYRLVEITLTRLISW